MADNQRVAIIRANLGEIDKLVVDEPQTAACEVFEFNDQNFPPRYGAMTPRLQAKIPKMFAWQMMPNYDFYLWLDGNLRLSDKGALKYLLEKIVDYDIVVLQHPRRNTIHWEYRYNWRGLHSNAPSNYLTKRYTNEFLDEQYDVIKSDPDFVDDLLVNGGVFLYRNTEVVQKMLKEWWYHVSRYCVMDQMSFAYLLKTSGLAVRILPDNFADTWWLENKRHAK